MSEDKTKNGGKGKPDNSAPSDDAANRSKASPASTTGAPGGSDAPSKSRTDTAGQPAAAQAGTTTDGSSDSQSAKPAQAGHKPQSKDRKTKESNDASSRQPSASPGVTGKSTTATSPSSTAAAGSNKPRGSASQAATSSSATPPPRTGSANGGSNNRPGPARNGGGQGSARNGSLGLVIAIVALIIALLAAAGAGWLWYRSQTKVADLSSRVNTVEQSMQSNVQKVVMPRLSDMKDNIQSLSSNVNGLSDRLDERQKQVKKLQAQIRQVQAQNTKLADRLDGTHRQYTEQRIEALLKAANERLRLYHDPATAQQALELADQAVQQSGDPRLFPVRRDIADEVAALKALPSPDIEGLSLKLSNLIEQVPKLPLATDVPSEYHNGQSAGDDSTQTDSNALSSIDVSRGWHHFVDSLSGALSSMVTVRRANGTQNAPALMAPDQAYFLTQNLQLQLRSAQLELLNHDTQAYQDSLSSARDWIKQYFDVDESSVKAVLDTFNELSNVKLDWQTPDISASLSTLHHVMAGQHNTADTGGSAKDDAANGDGDNGGSEQ